MFHADAPLVDVEVKAVDRGRPVTPRLSWGPGSRGRGPQAPLEHLLQRPGADVRRRTGHPLRQAQDRHDDHDSRIGAGCSGPGSRTSTSRRSCSRRVRAARSRSPRFRRARSRRRGRRVPDDLASAPVIAIAIPDGKAQLFVGPKELRPADVARARARKGGVVFELPGDLRLREAGLPRAALRARPLGRQLRRRDHPADDRPSPPAVPAEPVLDGQDAQGRRRHAARPAEAQGDPGEVQEEQGPRSPREDERRDDGAVQARRRQPVRRRVRLPPALDPDADPLGVLRRPHGDGRTARSAVFRLDQAT